MGTTLYSALLDHNGNLKPLWSDLLDKKVSLLVLLQGMALDQQGQFAFDVAAIAAMKGESIDSIITHSEAVKNVLIPATVKYSTLDVRLANTAINHSAFLVKDSQNTLAVQVHPYTGMGDLNVRGVRFNFTGKSGRHLSEMEYQIVAVWKKARSL